MRLNNAYEISVFLCDRIAPVKESHPQMSWNSSLKLRQKVKGKTYQVLIFEICHLLVLVLLFFLEAWMELKLRPNAPRFIQIWAKRNLNQPIKSIDETMS